MEEFTQTPAAILSVGPDRAETMIVRPDLIWGKGRLSLSAKHLIAERVLKAKYAGLHRPLECRHPSSLITFDRKAAAIDRIPAAST